MESRKKIQEEKPSNPQIELDFNQMYSDMMDEDIQAIFGDPLFARRANDP